MKKKSLAFKMSVALVLGIIAGTLAIIARENVSADTWQLINKLLFADISQSGNENALGLFYIIGQLFIKSLQLIIVPMVFTSITLAMVKISDAKKLGRISTKTVLTFLTTSVVALIMAGIVGSVISYSGLFVSLSVEGLSASTGSTSSNPLLILLNAVPSNVVSAFSNNSGVLAVVFMAVVVGLAINNLGDKVTHFTKLCGEVSSIVTVALSYIVNTFGPLAIFALITRTFAAYGIEYLKPAFIYMLVTTILLLIYLVFGYSTFIALLAKLNPIPFVKKIVKVALFGFSTSSSAATLPLNLKTTTEELGVHEEISSFVLPLGMTINMDGTAIMQVIAAVFIATCGGYELSVSSIFLIAVLALVASIGTPAAPGAGAIVLFTILSGMGYSNDMALMAYTLILAINRPIEMLVTSLNVVGDSAASIIVAKKEGLLDEETYNK
ncbi:MAG: dicarboxylate/amino acid:cation symporter [Erysipelotrichaceae bacterium]